MSNWQWGGSIIPLLIAQTSPLLIAPRQTKTVSVALSREQYEPLKEAIDNWHQAQEILHRMQALSRLVIFETLPSPPRRKRLGKRVLGLI
jgi:hypothetical protein